MTGRLQAFPTQEFKKRLQRVQSDMRECGLDMLLIHAPENIYYLTGYQNSATFSYQTLVVTDAQEPTLLLRYLEKGAVDEYSWLESCETWRESDDVVVRTAEVARALGGGAASIGIEKSSWFLTADVAERLAEKLPRATFIDASQLVDRIRLVKSERELAYIRRAGAIVELEMRAAIEIMRPGVTEAEVAAAVLHTGVLAGCEYTGLPQHIQSGHRSNVAHGNWTPKVIELGELVVLELFGCVERYHATQLRVVSLGRPRDDARQAAALVIKAQDEALRALRPGASSKAVDALVRGPIRTIRPDYYNRSGYSTGIGFPPRTAEWQTLDFNEHDDWEVKEGMAFHMYAFARGVGISETVVVTRSGAERATPGNPRELIIV
ncbi:Xaa-Pro peptidase family protein [Mesorhizobium sp. M1322]|uniref:M24 family metallopeptidase n=1 Tax=Mesorhizobium sp. M1322 TaxID=2957081 RepID=UPI00333C92D6